MELNPLVRAVSTVALAATAFFTLAAFMTLPADAVLAIHWSINGVADGFAGKEALLFIPVTTALVSGLLWLALRYDPKRANLARSGDALGLVVVALSLLGVCDDFMAEPFHRFKDPERARVAAILSELGLLPS